MLQFKVFAGTDGFFFLWNKMTLFLRHQSPLVSQLLIILFWNIVSCMRHDSLPCTLTSHCPSRRQWWENLLWLLSKFKASTGLHQGVIMWIRTVWASPSAVKYFSGFPEFVVIRFGRPDSTLIDGHWVPWFFFLKSVILNPLAGWLTFGHHKYQLCIAHHSLMYMRNYRGLSIGKVERRCSKWCRVLKHSHLSSIIVSEHLVFRIVLKHPKSRPFSDRCLSHLAVLTC